MAAALGKTGHPVRGHENGGLSDRRFRRPIVPWDAYFIVVFTLSAATATRALIGSATSPKIFTIVSLIFDASAISESNFVLAKSFCLLKNSFVDLLPESIFIHLVSPSHPSPEYSSPLCQRVSA